MNKLPERITRQKPDFGNFELALRNKTPKYLPFYELFVDVEIMETILEHPVPHIMSGTFVANKEIKEEEVRLFNDATVEFYYKMGYDYVPAIPIVPLQKSTQSTSGPARKISAQKRIFQDEHKGPIQNWHDFEEYEWPTIAEVDFSNIEYISSILPEGMKLVSGLPGLFENVSWLPGIEKLCYMLYDEPDLVAALFNKVGSLWVEVFEALSQIDTVGALLLADDLGFYGGTFLPPDILREHLFPWYSQIGSIAKREDKPFILHTCGNSKEIMPDLIATGINAKHSFEDKIQPIWEAKKNYGDKIALLGGIDMGVLASASEEKTRQYVRFVLERCADRGYALGSGNSIADYVKIENYLAMLDEGRKFRDQT